MQEKHKGGCTYSSSSCFNTFRSQAEVKTEAETSALCCDALAGCYRSVHTAAHLQPALLQVG